MQALILAGGSGTRFWPLSRERRPKQLLAMIGDRSLLQITVARLDPLIGPRAIWVCTTERLVEAVRRQLPGVPDHQILAEPEGRNTAPAIGWSLDQMPAKLREGVVAVLPADHFVADPAVLRTALACAGEVAASQGRIMTLGVRPTRAEIGYGYLELGETLDGPDGLRRVRRFTEKPDLAAAESFLAGDGYLWNAGMFVFRGTVLLARLAEHQPQIMEGLVEIRRGPERLVEIYRELPAISIDHGVMERLDDLGTLPLDCGWSDLGSWEALWQQLDGDVQGNVSRGSVLPLDCSDSLLIAEQGTLAAVGLEGLVVVSTGDAVLVIPRKRTQDVRRIVDELRRRGLDALL